MTLAEDNAHLRAENADLRALVAQLQEQLAAALQRIAELEQDRRDPPAFVKPARPARPDPKPPRKKRAPEHNQARRRAPPTHTQTHALERCPACQYRLRGHSVAYRRQVIELPPPSDVQVIEHHVLKRYCPRCQCWRTPPLNVRGQVLGPRGRIGVRLAAVVAYLRTTLRLPIRQIQQYLASVHHLTLSTGAIVGVLHRVRQAAAPTVAALQAEARASPVLHCDETGWREQGQNGYVWTLSTSTVRWFHFDSRRADAVLRRLLGGTFDGHLVSDYYAAYNWYAGPQQRCWVHLLRDLHALREAHPQRSDVQQWVAAVRALYDRARGLEPRYLTDLHYALLVSESHTLGLRYAQEKSHPCQALAKRLLRHEAELFQFVRVPELSPDNNLAERSLRPLVIARKMSGGTRSPAGTQTRMDLTSLFATWQLRGRNPFTACLHLLSQQTPLPQL